MDIIVPTASGSPMNPESKQNGGKTSPPVVCDDPQQQHPNQQQQRPTRYINNSTLVGGVNKVNTTRSNSSASNTSKNKSLVRSHAVSEETSPPPPDGVSGKVVSSMNNNKNGKLRQQSSQQSSSLESSLSLDNNFSNEKNCSEDNELLDFIIDTLNRSAKDRTLILRIESDLISFIKDPSRSAHNFPQMTSYQRMLVHRVSGYFHLEHNLDNSATCVVVTKTKGTRVPETRFREYIEDQQQDLNKTVLKRDASGPRKGNEEQVQQGLNRTRGKSLEEKTEDYNRARRRIFNSDQQQDPGVYCWSSSTESNTTNDPQGKQTRHFNRKSTTQNSSTLLKVESFETATINRKNKPPVVNKSYSFGGYGATDGNNVVIGNSNNMSLNRFSKQDSSSSSSGLSPASSGYKSQSFQSSTENTMTTPNSSSSPQNNLAAQESTSVLSVEGIPPPTAVSANHSSHHHQCVLAAPVQSAPLSQQQYIFYPASSSSLGLMQGAPLQMQPQQTPLQHPQQNPSQSENVVLWAVTDMNHVPPGSILIDPNSGQALKNNDGTMYHYDPTNPPKHVISQPQTELVMYQSPQPHMQQQRPQLVNTPSGDVDHMAQWFTQMGVHQPPPQPQHAPAGQQWGEEYFVASPHQQQPPPPSSFITAGGPSILWDPSKISTGAIGLNQQYYPVPAHPPPPHPPPPSQQPHYVVAAPPGPQQPPPQQVVMQYSVPSSSATGAPYMSYMLQPYSPIVAAAAAAAANYNLVPYGQQPSQAAPRPILPNTVHQQPQQPIKFSKEFCYVPTSTNPTPGGNNAACLYNPFYGNAMAAAAAAAAHVQNQQPGGGHRFPGNPPMYPAQFIPRPSSSGFNNYRSNVKPPRKNRARNFSSNNERSSSQTQQQQQQSSDKNS
ncbi:unnamed protein product [Allacma fusca]|uniref:Uncharacterized protein n=1 Tax=Allacma fusca TaxID=39272 RepID=A0A8J2LQC6_9HEXA|nr:unnamed protein product [Allacma fusca]